MINIQKKKKIKNLPDFEDEEGHGLVVPRNDDQKYNTFTKTVNLITKYLDKDALINVTEDKFFNGDFLNDFKEAHINEYNLEQNNDNDDDKKNKTKNMIADSYKQLNRRRKKK